MLSKYYCQDCDKYKTQKHIYICIRISLPTNIILEMSDIGF